MRGTTLAECFSILLITRLVLGGETWLIEYKRF